MLRAVPPEFIRLFAQGGRPPKLGTFGGYLNISPLAPFALLSGSRGGCRRERPKIACFLYQCIIF